MFKAIRVILLLFILFLVAGVTWVTKYRALKWDEEKQYDADSFEHFLSAKKRKVTKGVSYDLQSQRFTAPGNSGRKD